MSTLAAWSYVATLTIWKFSGEDKFNVATYDAPFTVLGDWAEGGATETDVNGEEFVATSVYFYELAEDDVTLAARGDFILKGDHTAQANPNTAGAEKIKKITGWEMEKFGEGELPDWKIST